MSKEKEILYEIEEMAVKKIYDTKTELNHQYSDILKHEDDFYRQAYTQLEIVCSNQIQQLDDWKQNYIDSTNMAYDGTSEIIERQKKAANEDAKQRILDYIAFKAQMLMDQFPEQTEFFKSKGWISPIAKPETSKYPFRPETTSSIDDFKNVMFPDYEDINRYNNDIDFEPNNVIEKISNLENLNNEEISNAFQFNNNQHQNNNNTEFENAFDSHHDNFNEHSVFGIDNNINFDKMFPISSANNTQVSPKAENNNNLEKNSHINNQDLNKVGSNNSLGSLKYFEDPNNFDDSFDEDPFENYNKVKVISPSKNAGKDLNLDVSNYFKSNSNLDTEKNPEKDKSFNQNQIEAKSYLESIVNTSPKTPNANLPSSLENNNSTTNNVEVIDHPNASNSFEPITSFGHFDSNLHPNTNDKPTTINIFEPIQKSETIISEPTNKSDFTMHNSVDNSELANMFNPSNDSKPNNDPIPNNNSEPTNISDSTNNFHPTNIFEPPNVIAQNSIFEPNISQSTNIPSPENVFGSTTTPDSTNNNETNNNYETEQNHEPTIIPEHSKQLINPTDSSNNTHDFKLTNDFESADNLVNNDTNLDKSSEDEEKNYSDSHPKNSEDDDDQNDFDMNPDQPEITAKFVIGQIKIGETIALNLPEGLALVGKIVSFDSDMIKFVTEEDEEISIPIAQFEDPRYFLRTLY